MLVNLNISDLLFQKNLLIDDTVLFNYIFISKCTLILLINSCIIHTRCYLTRKSQITFQKNKNKKSQITTGIQLSDFPNVLAYNFQKLGKLYPQ